ncbi:DUF6997 domain-containing protein [Gottfriedia acidiceleris]|uniref:DUF6997 domain-containing protein n=1 Tax=Gottfriedia acidiceleris TaxID=371036 RepID=UPI00101C3E79|nr:hypothetical protein [Gottfriedia acidiceleris]
MSVFKYAIKEMIQESKSIYGPCSFQDYLKSNNINNQRTASFISVDAYEVLNRELRENNTMVLRIGVSLSNNTQFALVKPNLPIIDEYFLSDEQLFTDIKGSTFLPTASYKQLFGFNLLPSLSETTLVNLGLASGIISAALNLDNYEIPLAPSTGKSTFSFNLNLHSEYNYEVLHNNGQVEVDAIFIEKRNGKESVFVLEAKSNSSYKSLAKHKLVYPILAIASKVPKDMEIIPVYIKVFNNSEGLHYHILECSFPDPRIETRAINELKPVKHNHLILPFFQEL